jgi:hypothetical protein
VVADPPFSLLVANSFPEDRLAQEFERRNKDASPLPVGLLPRVAVLFAREQLKMMNQGQGE